MDGAVTVLDRELDAVQLSSLSIGLSPQDADSIGLVQDLTDLICCCSIDEDAIIQTGFTVADCAQFHSAVAKLAKLSTVLFNPTIAMKINQLLPFCASQFSQTTPAPQPAARLVP
jgi:hypothetical protein